LHFWKEQAEELNLRLTCERTRPQPADAWDPAWREAEPKNDPPLVNPPASEQQDALEQIRKTREELVRSAKRVDEPPHEELVAGEGGTAQVGADVASVDPRGASPLAGSDAATPHSSDGEDDSIELYMSRLLERIRGEQPAPRAPAVSPSQPPTPAPAPAALAGPAPRADSQALAAELPRLAAPPASPIGIPLATHSPATPRKPPEQTTDLAAMRELANTSTRAAIQTSHVRNRTQDLTARLMMVASVLLATLGIAFAVRSKPMLVGLVSAAGIWFCLWLNWPGLRWKGDAPPPEPAEEEMRSAECGVQNEAEPLPG
jgi:hypothetical protein